MSDKSTSLYRRVLVYEKQNIDAARRIAADDRYREASWANGPADSGTRGWRRTG
jgi:hypothetical protein